MTIEQFIQEKNFKGTVVRINNYLYLCVCNSNYHRVFCSAMS